MNFESYDELAALIAQLTPEQRKQRPQVCIPGPDGDAPVILQPIFELATVHDLFETDGEGHTLEEPQETKDSYDGTHKPESVVIMGDISGHEPRSRR
jgi:hypothetical protein